MSDETRKNFLSDVEKVFGDITGTYATLVDLSTNYLYRVMQVASTLDQPIILKFENTATVELTVPPGWQIPLPEFWHDGVIQVKHAGTPPTEGLLKVLSWRAE